MRRKEIIEKKLSVLKPNKIDIFDNSQSHAGHSSVPKNSKETHFTIVISSEKLDKLTKVEQHRTVKNLLKSEFETGLHALNLKIIPTYEI